MSQERIVQPPVIAAWLVDLFVTHEQTAIREQMRHKFSNMVVTYGIGPARRWYWSRSAKTIAGLMGKEFRTAPWLIVCTALGAALLLQLGTSYLQRAIMAIILFLNHHVTPYYDPRGVARREFWMANTVLIGSLLESLIAGSLVAVAAKGREMIAAMTLSLVCLVMTPTIFWALVTERAPVNPVFFPHIMVDQLGGSLLMIIGGIIVREIRSAARLAKPAGA